MQNANVLTPPPPRGHYCHYCGCYHCKFALLQGGPKISHCRIINKSYKRLPMRLYF